jgi:hypothetical protein
METNIDQNTLGNLVDTLCVARQALKDSRRLFYANSMEFAHSTNAINEINNNLKIVAPEKAEPVFSGSFKRTQTEDDHTEPCPYFGSVARSAVERRDLECVVNKQFFAPECREYEVCVQGDSMTSVRFLVRARDQLTAEKEALKWVRGTWLRGTDKRDLWIGDTNIVLEGV